MPQVTIFIQKEVETEQEAIELLNAAKYGVSEKGNPKVTAVFQKDLTAEEK